MKVLPFKIPKSSEKVFIYQEDKQPLFYDKLHAHKEIQISIILKGRGELIVGDSLRSFSPGDVFIFGANLPHLLKSDPAIGESYMQSLFFTESSFGMLFSILKEDHSTSVFLQTIANGLKINSQLDRIKRKFGRLAKSDELTRTILFFELLQILILAQKESLSSSTSMKTYTENQGRRMGEVVQLAFSEYHRDIKLSEVAQIANLTSNAFCRYFKQHTNKTFFTFLVDIRLENAGKMLLRNKLISVSEVAELCGFKNLSYFNRQFKKHYAKTPKDYRRTFSN